MEELNIILTILMFLIGLILIALPPLIAFIVFRIKTEYIAKKHAEAFEYDYLAEKIAEEICKKCSLLKSIKLRQAMKQLYRTIFLPPQTPPKRRDIFISFFTVHTATETCYVSPTGGGCGRYCVPCCPHGAVGYCR